MSAPPPVAEPIFPAVRLPRRRSPFPTEGGTTAILAFCFGVTWLLAGGCIGLSFAALLRHEWQCLPWVALGFILAVGIPGAVVELCARFTRPKPNVTEPKAEEALRFLRDEAPNDALAARLRTRREAAWLTGDGAYVGSGEHFGWDRLQQFRLVPRKGDVLEIWLQVPLTRRQATALKAVAAAGALLLLIAPAAEIFAAAYGASLPAVAGPRDDMLAAAFAAASQLVGGAGMGFLTVDRVRAFGVTQPVLILLVDSRHSPRERIHALLTEHLPEADPLS